MFVYILYSSSLGKYYVGHTYNVEKRLMEHNSGKGNFTKKGVPWQLIKVIPCDDRSEAVRVEEKIKKRGIKRFLDNS